MAVAVVVVAVSAVVSASASAASWRVGGEELVGSASLASAMSMTERVIWEYGTVSLECGGVELKGASIVGPSGGSIEHMVFTGCEVYGSGGCFLKSATIESKPLSVAAALGGKSPEDALVLKPVSGKVFAEFQVGGVEGCLFAGVNQLKGKAMLVLPRGREELAEQEVLIRTTASSEEFKWNEGFVAFTGGVKAKLASGKAWSFH